MDRLDGTYSVRSFGAVCNGEQDDTAAIQEAIDKAAERGGNVFLPPGQYLVAGSINVRPGVSVYGIHNAPCSHDKLCGTVLLAVDGRGDADGPPLFRVGESAMVRGLAIYYPNQRINDIQPYPWTFVLEDSDQSVQNITLINSYQALRVGPAPNSRHRVRGIHGCVLRRGIYVDNSSDSGRIENCNFHPHWWSHEAVGGDLDKAREYMEEHLEAYVFGRADGEYVAVSSVFSAQVAWRFLETPGGGYNGHVADCSALSVRTAFDVRQLQAPGLRVTGGRFSACDHGARCLLQVGRGCNTGGLRFTNTAFQGPAQCAADLDGDCFVSFQNCCFTHAGPDIQAPVIRARHGRLQLHGCSFETARPCLELESGLRHAIVTANNGTHGFGYLDHTQGRSIIRDNEPA